VGNAFGMISVLSIWGIIDSSKASFIFPILSHTHLLLVKLGMVKDKILRQAFIKVRFGSREWLNPQAEPIFVIH
jgi:hypothetical protein